MKLLNTTAVARALLATGLVFAGGGQALAQDASSEQAGASTTDPSTATGEDIVVTAQKREERVQDIPLAVQVISGQTLEAQGIREFSELTRAAPSLLVRSAEHPVNASISIRGIGTFAFSPSVEPSVAVQIDDVPVQFLARAFADLSDIERIEVLRGPQSTLYGRAASAGLLNIVTQGPTSELSGRISGLATTDSEYGLSGSLSGPISPTLGFRVSANYDNFKGNVRNLFNGDKVNGREILSLRGKLVWKPTDTLNFTAQVGYIDGHTTIGRPFIRVSPAARLRGNAAYGPSVFAPGVTFGEDSTDVVNNVTSGTDYTDFSQSLRGSLDLGFASLVSITAWDHFKQFDILDQDESAIAALDNTQAGTFNVHSFSQELRLVSPGTQPFRYTFGLFYSDLDVTRDFVRGPFFSVANWYATNGNKQYAAFGQLEYDIIEGTTLIGGARVGRNKIYVTFQDRTGARPYFAGDNPETYETYKLGIQQKFTPDIMAFFTYATGHKGEAYDVGTGFNATRLVPVRPETSKDWQLGLKTQFADRRVTLNATLFNTTFDDFQAQGIETLSDGTINFRLANVGKLRTRGVEIEGSVRAGDDLNFSGGVTYTDAKILSFPFGQCYPGQSAAQGCVGSPARQNLAGYRPAQAPEWKLSLSGDYTPALTSSLDGVVQAAFNYQSKFNFGINNDPETIQKGYGILNLSLGVRDHDKKWEVVAFVNNAFDKQYFFNMNNSYGNQGNAQAIQSNLPRDFRRYGGVRASFNF
ncbi:TonB-dependent receptor [Sphingomonas alpina]|uniref:TonB-dependent receptor n=1 Tax=Sphingomonas alpina TaxID=653931 RepID=A0A7H0LG45_9SPHN|nr:TonB-dependent receptor [Sphingomonas alpina]QNQ08648.1 TonB-dependent receptor [Sphingomonas alpina]